MQNVTVKLQNGHEKTVSGDSVLVALSHGCLVVTVLDGPHKKEYCWPPEQWEGYEIEAPFND